MSQALNMPILGILFQIDKIEQYVDPGNYLVGAWKVVWRALDADGLKDCSGALLYECDTDGGIDGCCVAIQSMDRTLLRRIRDRLLQSTEYRNVAARPMFIEDEIARAQPLMQAGRIDDGGNITGNTAYCSRPALDAVRSGSREDIAMKSINLEDIKRELQDEDDVIRMNAARKLGEERSDESVELLLVALNDSDWGVRKTAAKILGEYNDLRAVEPLIEKLKDQDSTVRWISAEALQKLGDLRAVQPLIEALKDKDEDVRRCAANALGVLKDSRAIDALKLALKDQDWLVPKIAGQALNKITDNSSDQLAPPKRWYQFWK